MKNADCLVYLFNCCIIEPRNAFSAHNMTDLKQLLKKATNKDIKKALTKILQAADSGWEGERESRTRGLFCHSLSQISPAPSAVLHCQPWIKLHPVAWRFLITIQYTVQSGSLSLSLSRYRLHTLLKHDHVVISSSCYYLYVLHHFSCFIPQHSYLCYSHTGIHTSYSASLPKLQDKLLSLDHRTQD